MMPNVLKKLNYPDSNECLLPRAFSYIIMFMLSSLFSLQSNPRINRRFKIDFWNANILISPLSYLVMSRLKKTTP